MAVMSKQRDIVYIKIQCIFRRYCTLNVPIENIYIYIYIEKKEIYKKRKQYSVDTEGGKIIYIASNHSENAKEKLQILRTNKEC